MSASADITCRHAYTQQLISHLPWLAALLKLVRVPKHAETCSKWLQRKLPQGVCGLAGECLQSNFWHVTRWWYSANFACLCSLLCIVTQTRTHKLTVCTACFGLSKRCHTEDLVSCLANKHGFGAQCWLERQCTSPQTLRPEYLAKGEQRLVDAGSLLQHLSGRFSILQPLASRQIHKADLPKLGDAVVMLLGTGHHSINVHSHDAVAARRL